MPHKFAGYNHRRCQRLFLTAIKICQYNPVFRYLFGGVLAMDDLIVIMVSVGSEQQAITIAEELIQQELIACVNILPTMRSIYRFKGRIFDDEENLLLIKTSKKLFDEVSAVISQMHTYEVPEIIGVRVDRCEENFRDWVEQSVFNGKSQDP